MTEAATGHGRERDSCPMLDPTVHTRIYIYTHTSRWKNRHLTPPRVKLCAGRDVVPALRVRRNRSVRAGKKDKRERNGALN